MKLQNHDAGTSKRSIESSSVASSPYVAQAHAQPTGKNVRKNAIAKQTSKELYRDRNDTGDVTFIVDSEKIHAHRCVLAALSPKYKAQFYGPNRDAGDIEMKDITAAAFNEFLQFFYLDEVILTVENIESTLNLAQQSLVDEFIEECIAFLMETVAVDNLCSVYRLAILFDIEKLISSCELLIRSNTQKLFDTRDFLDCDACVLIRILKMDSLRCSEAQVFNACILWAENVCKQKHIDANIENVRIELGIAVREIRFASMKIDEFLTLNNAHNGFFTPNEFQEIIYIINKFQHIKSDKFNQNVRKQM